MSTVSSALDKDGNGTRVSRSPSPSKPKLDVSFSDSDDEGPDKVWNDYYTKLCASGDT